jgi:hypothetical protein
MYTAFHMGASINDVSHGEDRTTRLQTPSPQKTLEVVVDSLCLWKSIGIELYPVDFSRNLERHIMPVIGSFKLESHTMSAINDSGERMPIQKQLT